MAAAAVLLPAAAAGEKRTDSPQLLALLKTAPLELPPLDSLEATAPPLALVEVSRALAFAPPPALQQRSVGPDVYYSFVDERGVIHLTNVPGDPRYRRQNLPRPRLSLAALRPAASLWLSHRHLKPIIEKAAAAYGLDPALIAAVIMSESSFNARAVSRAGAKGLMQLMPATARELGCRNPFDPEQNIMAGSRYLRRLLNRFQGDITLAVAAYNCGPEPVARSGQVPNITETKRYVRTVSHNYRLYQEQF